MTQLFHFSESNGAFRIPSVRDAGAQSRVGHADFVSPLGHTVRLAVNRQHMRPAGVAGLRALSGPAAVVLTVVAVVVDSVKRTASGGIAHVVMEVLKGQPSFAYRYASSSVQRIVARVRIRASVNHVRPSSKRKRDAVLPCLAVNGGRIRYETSATARAGGSRELSSGHGGVLSAVAQTFPPAKAAHACQFDNCQSSEALPSKVVDLHRFPSIWASMIRRTSSAMEMPRRFASRLRNILCGSVNEIICLVISARYQGVQVSSTRWAEIDGNFILVDHEHPHQPVWLSRWHLGGPEFAETFAGIKISSAVVCGQIEVSHPVGVKDECVLPALCVVVIARNIRVYGAQQLFARSGFANCSELLEDINHLLAIIPQGIQLEAA